MAYYGTEKAEDEPASLMRATRKYDCGPVGIVTVAEKLGFGAQYKERSNIEEITSFIDKKIPAMFRWFSSKKNGHYPIISGYEGDNLVMIDPFTGSIRKITS